MAAIYSYNNILIYNDNKENKLFIKGLDEDVKVLKITNLLGQTVKTYFNLANDVIENGLKIDYLNSGIYIVNVESENKESSKKIIVSKT